MVDKAGLLLRSLAPASGANCNENNPFNPDWKADFYGAHYSRLRRIKRRYDPHDVF